MPSAAATSAAETRATSPQSVLSFLSDAINWYRHLNSEAQLVEEPSETLYYAEDRQTASDILSLAFDYARKAADFLAKSADKNLTAGGPRQSASAIGTKLASIQQELTDAQTRLKALQAQFAQARAKERNALASQIVATQGEIDLAQARADALGAILQYQTGTSSPEQSTGLRGQIDELQKSIPESEQTPQKNSAATAPLAAKPTQSSGTTGLVFELLALRHKQELLDQSLTQTNIFISDVTRVREPFLRRIQDLDARGNEFAKSATSSDTATLRKRKKEFDALVEEHKAMSALSLPLSKQLVLLEAYSNNVERWRGAIRQRMRQDFRSLSIRLASLGLAFLLIFGVAFLWKILTLAYVKDIRRRGQVLAARRLVVGLLVVIVLLIAFSDQLGSFATVLGFAAAGVAVALQNVILSIAGYFFLIGRFGIKAGDRVQIGGVTGDVVDVGLVKLSLMELGGNTGSHLQPTGRVVVYSNAVVFQPNGNFFKQAPGTSFVWNEIRLTLAPDCDYRLAEKRLTDAVDQVYARYREQVQGDYRHLERDLNIILDSPKPQSRLSLGSAGLEVIIRYPAQTRQAAQVADEVARRVLDAIAREPGLRLVTGPANIQPVPIPASDDAAAEKESA